MPKVEIDQIEFTARSVGIDSKKIEALVRDLAQAIQEEKERKENMPRNKRQHIVIANTEGLSEDIVKALPEIPIVVVQCSENSDHNEVLGNIHRASYKFNADIGKRKNSKKTPVKKVFEAILNVTRKHFKEVGVTVNSKEPVILITTDNSIPTEKTANDTVQ